MADTAGETRHYRICPLCEACCGLEIRTRDGRIASIRGAEDDPFSRGYICPKAVALKDLHEDPDRLRSPLIKRNGRHERASWEEAFDEIARRLPPIMAGHGRDAVAFSFGNPAAHRFGTLLYVPRLVKAIGSRNVYSASTLDQMPKQLACGLMFGHWLSIPVPDIERCDHLLILGANPMASNGSLWTVPDFRAKAKALRARGGKLVVIDPRRSETAEVADAHHFIRPGSDAFLLAAMLQVLFADGLVKPGRLAEHWTGLDEVRTAVEPFTPERVAARCGVAAGAIRTLAHELAAAPRACVYGRIGTCTQEFGTAASWLIDLLNALTGNLDREGGAMFSKAPAFARNTQGKPGIGGGVPSGRFKSRVSGAPEVFGELPMTLLAEEIETPGPGQVKALLTLASNPVLSAPGGPRLAKALSSLDFMVSVDIYLNETTRHADVVLPSLSTLEESHYDIAFPQFSWRNNARFSAAVFAPPPEQIPEWQILLKLAAIAKGQGSAADVQALDDEFCADSVRPIAGDNTAAVLRLAAGLRGPERLLDLSLRAGPYGDGFGARPDGLNLAKLRAAPAGIDLGPLQPRIPEILRTASGKIELAPAPFVAELQRARAELDKTVQDEWLIIGRRDVRSNNSWMHNLPTLAKGPNRCTLLVNPADAQRLGLTQGRQARISRNGTSVQAEVELSEAMMPGVVSLPHGWGHDLPGAQLSLASQRPGANLNAVLDETRRDLLSGNAVLSGVGVAIAPA